DPRLNGLIALDDPRRDPVTRALAAARLADGPWAEGYAELVRAASQAPPIGRVPGSAVARLLRGGAAIAPSRSDEDVPGPRYRWQALGPGPFVGVGVCRDAGNPSAAGLFLRFLDAHLGLEPAPEPAEVLTLGLLADLLGAT